jgi:hypothetical protein
MPASVTLDWKRVMYISSPHSLQRGFCSLPDICAPLFLRFFDAKTMDGRLGPYLPQIPDVHKKQSSFSIARGGARDVSGREPRKILRHLDLLKQQLIDEFFEF